MQSTSLISIVTDVFRNAILKGFPHITNPPVSICVSNPHFGDYQCNSALIIYKEHKEALEHEKSVTDVARTIHEHLDTSSFSETCATKQGFITVKFSLECLSQLLTSHGTDEISIEVEPKLKCLVDYSSPNIAKEMHVGHLRSTILGEAISRVLEFCGHKVFRINHVGDWGTQFGMLIQHLKETFPNFQKEPPTLATLTSLYKQAKLRFDSDPDFKRRAQLTVPLLQRGDEEARAAWKLFCDISRQDFQAIYDKLNIHLVERGESFYNDMIPSVVEEIAEKGLTTDVSGAQCLFVPSDPVPLFVVKADGGYGYDSTDLAAIRYRLVETKHDMVLYVADIGQESHFHKVFKAAELMGWYDPYRQLCQHVGFGLVQGEDGKKFKTRSGDTVKLINLMDEAVSRCEKELEQRYVPEKDPDAKCLFNDKESIHQAAESMGYSAIRYFDLKQNRVSNYKFAYDKMLDPKGNTAVYLLYAYARICSIFRKTDVPPHVIRSATLNLVDPVERKLVLQILKFYEVVRSVAKDFYMHRIAEYMYNLCGAFTTFYQTCKVISSENEQSRLLLCYFTQQYLKKSFYLLGIDPLDQI